MLPRHLPRNFASRILARPLECQFHQQPQLPTVCAFSTTLTNRHANSSSPRDATAPGERPARVVKTSTTPKQPGEIEKKLQAHAAKLARSREEQLREARQRRANRISQEKTKKAQVEAEEETGERELTKEEKERKEKEDYKKRYKQLERNWIKFMVGMPVFLVMSYDLFQRLVMKREQKVPPWKQARLNKEKEEREKQEREKLTEGERIVEN
ncbi:hypothetical protein FHETE_6787 [Fusarium heterosporum]|uniref:Uncharacterized protein n=1 Tax=Fusarium heterosporum TaxID=42747 RepID=A0A8H5T5T4_FUSHE|nr:hypothetical protein FHETE_6787 [Fusarium heterosporum]